MKILAIEGVYEDTYNADPRVNLLRAKLCPRDGR
jgi:hypothetical protein